MKTSASMTCSITLHKLPRMNDETRHASESAQKRHAQRDTCGTSKMWVAEKTGGTRAEYLTKFIEQSWDFQKLSHPHHATPGIANKQT